jgi:hypothetical protein
MTSELLRAKPFIMKFIMKLMKQIIYSELHPYFILADDLIGWLNSTLRLFPPVCMLKKLLLAIHPALSAKLLPIGFLQH